MVCLNFNTDLAVGNIFAHLSMCASEYFYRINFQKWNCYATFNILIKTAKWLSKKGVSFFNSYQ